MQPYNRVLKRISVIKRGPRRLRPVRPIFPPFTISKNNSVFPSRNDSIVFFPACSCHRQSRRDVFAPGGESVELQVDYWLSGASAAAAAAAASATARESIASAAAISLATMAQAVKREKGPAEQSSVKYTVKAGFRWIVVQRLPHCNMSTTTTSSAGDASSLFTMTFGLKEKKQKSELFVDR